MSRTPDARARDNQTRKIQENITNVEKHFGEMCQLFAAYARKTARLRDKADLLVREIGVYADTETPNLKKGLKQFADHLAKVEDYRQAEVERLEAKVIEPLKSYGAVVKRKREDLKATQSARDREAKQMAQLERTRQRNPSDRQIISQAESELQRATMDATRTTRQLEETIDEFEMQKIRDIKVFRSSLHPPDYQSRLDIVRANSKTSLDRTGSFLSTSGTLQQQRTGNRQTRREEEEEEDEEDEEESEEEDEEDDTDDEN
ncbi:protein FAM92A isoform X2 [Cheilinus undulatus]|uniref:protein FAM92A isoform X2 n=1 Tax=Cheilinus undulatus TaxID=241271 RepID=UPI001BD6C956|nr:protein FAM92A isoform X2 [Cheilinus undulatus]